MKYAHITFAILALVSLSMSVDVFGQQSRSAGSANASPAWVQLAKLSSSDPKAYGNGGSVAISGNVIVVGAPGTFGGGLASVFVMPGGGWGNTTETAFLRPSDKPPGSNFGNSVAISGSVIAVGAPFSPPNLGGAVYVFVEPSGGWKGTVTETAKLTPSDATPNGGMGWSVAITGNTIVAGSPYQGNSAGGVYVFTKPSGGWTSATQTAKLVASDGQANQYFGTSVSVSGGVIVVGSPYATVGNTKEQGAAYVYVEPAAGWSNTTQTAKLAASDGQQYDDLGQSVSISGQAVAAGAFGQGAGAVYVFVESAGGWINATQTAKLTAAGGNAGDELGASVAIEGNFIVAGAPWFSPSNNQKFFHEGAGYIFVKPATGWANEMQTATLTGSDARLGAYLGTSVAISGNTTVSGASFNNYNLGATYVFSTFAGQ